MSAELDFSSKDYEWGYQNHDDHVEDTINYQAQEQYQAFDKISLFDRVYGINNSLSYPLLLKMSLWKKWCN